MSARPMRGMEVVVRGRRRVVSFFGPLPDDEAAEWRTWFERHGIDSGDVDPYGGVAADDVGRFVEYTPVGWWAEPAKTENGQLARTTSMVRVQLEARALAFPAYRPAGGGD